MIYGNYNEVKRSTSAGRPTNVIPANAGTSEMIRSTR